MQLNYGEMPIARAGMLALGASESFCVSRACEETGGIRAGVLVVGGTDPEKQCELPDAAGDLTNPLGISVFDPTQEPGTNTSGFEFDDEDPMAVIRRGQVWVLCEAAVTAGSLCYARYAESAAPGGEEIGLFGPAAIASEMAQVPGMTYATDSTTVTNAAGETQLIAVVDVNLPHAAAV